MDNDFAHNPSRCAYPRTTDFRTADLRTADLRAAYDELVAACNGRDWRDDPEDADRPETIQAMQIALDMPKQEPPARSALLAAAARAVVAVCLDARFLDELRPWYGHRIRKVARRARNKAWKDVQELPGITITHAAPATAADESGADTTGSAAQARVFPPSAVSEVDPRLGKLQIGHTDLPYDEPALPDDEWPVLYVDRALNMSAGKAAAQVGHASMLLAGSLPFAAVHTWAACGFPLAVREVPRAEFEAHCGEPGAVVVRDAGFTEIAPDSATVVAVPASLRG